MLRRYVNRALDRRHDAARLLAIRYQMECTASTLATLVLQGNEDSAKVLALRYNRLEKEASILAASIKRR